MENDSKQINDNFDRLTRRIVVLQNEIIEIKQTLLRMDKKNAINKARSTNRYGR